MIINFSLSNRWSGTLAEWPMKLKEDTVCHIFRESNFSQIGTSRHIHEHVKFAIEEKSNGKKKISIIHSFARALCTVLLVLRTQVAFPSHSWSGLEVNFLCVKFANRTRLAKFAKIKTPRNIWRIQY